MVPFPAFSMFGFLASAKLLPTAVFLQPVEHAAVPPLSIHFLCISIQPSAPAVFSA